MVIPFLLYGTHRPTVDPIWPFTEWKGHFKSLTCYKHNTTSRRPTAPTRQSGEHTGLLPVISYRIVGIFQGFVVTRCLLPVVSFIRVSSQKYGTNISLGNFGIYTPDYNVPNPSAQHCAFSVLYDIQMLQNNDMLTNGVLQIVFVLVSTVGLSTNLK
jgi:hypothetical protein